MKDIGWCQLLKCHISYTAYLWILTVCPLSRHLGLWDLIIDLIIYDLSDTNKNRLGRMLWRTISNMVQRY